MIALLPSVDVDAVVTRLWETLIAVAITLVVWRLATLSIDRLFVRRFAARFIPHAITFGALCKSAATVLAVVAAVLALLHIWGMDVTPAIWSAGIVTAGLAFGAQAVVRDILAGLSFLFEDVYEIGDAVEITTTVNSVVAGTIENLSLRLTVVVDESGRRFAIPNGNILMVANANKLAFGTSLTFTLPLRASIDTITKQLTEIGSGACAAAGISPVAVNVYVTDVGLDAATFRIEFPTSSSDAAVRSRMREYIVAKMQALGWLPGATPKTGVE
jgi:small-conductance mechanosensitive channel